MLEICRPSGAVRRVYDNFLQTYRPAGTKNINSRGVFSFPPLLRGNAFFDAPASSQVAQVVAISFYLIRRRRAADQNIPRRSVERGLVAFSF